MLFLCSKAPAIAGRIPRGSGERGRGSALGEAHPAERCRVCFPLCCPSVPAWGHGATGKIWRGLGEKQPPGWEPVPGGGSWHITGGNRPLCGASPGLSEQAQEMQLGSPGAGREGCWLGSRLEERRSRPSRYAAVGSVLVGSLVGDTLPQTASTGRAGLVSTGLCRARGSPALARACGSGDTGSLSLCQGRGCADVPPLPWGCLCCRDRSDHRDRAIFEVKLLQGTRLLLSPSCCRGQSCCLPRPRAARSTQCWSLPGARHLGIRRPV